MAGCSPDGNGKPAATAHSLLLITLDTTRADRLGVYGYERARTRALDDLASRGVTFVDAFSSVPLTLPSHATLLVGVHPPEHGIATNGAARLDLDLPTLAEVLGQRGWRTAAFIASLALDSRNGLDAGFDVYDDDLAGVIDSSEGPQMRISAYRSGEIVVGSALRWLRGVDPAQPFFAWVHLFDPHDPYRTHASLAATEFEGRASYDAEIAFMDLQVGRLLRFLGESGRLEDTVVVAVGDHGEGLDQHGEPNHGYLLYAETMRVPLIISAPGAEAGRQVGELVSLVDVFPTLLELLGVDDIPPRSGRSLRAALFGGEIESAASYGETDLPHAMFGWSPLRSVTTADWRYIRSARVHLYDRRADPGERNNLADSEPDRVDELDRMLTGMQEAMRRHEAAPLALSREDRERLRALGYLGQAAPSAPEEVDFSTLADIEEMLPVARQFWPMVALGVEGAYDAQIAMLRQMLEASPDTPVLEIHLGTALAHSGRLDDGIDVLSRVVGRAPDVHEPRARKALAFALSARKDFEASLEQLDRAGALDPRDAEVHQLRAQALEGLGRVEQAIDEYREAARLDPLLIEPANNLAWILATDPDPRLRNGAEAVRLAQRANELARGENPGVLDTLAAAYAEAGHYGEARATLLRALRLGRAAGADALVADLEPRLLLYQADRPYYTEPRH